MAPAERSISSSSRQKSISGNGRGPVPGSLAHKLTFAEVRAVGRWPRHNGVVPSVPVTHANIDAACTCRPMAPRSSRRGRGWPAWHAGCMKLRRQPTRLRQRKRRRKRGTLQPRPAARPFRWLRMPGRLCQAIGGATCCLLVCFWMCGWRPLKG